jgi:HlyD family secretion protein
MIAAMRRWIVRLVVILVIVGVGLALRATVFAPKPVTVTAVAISRGRVEQTVTNSRAGTVKARRRAQISPEVGGRVVEVPFREGDAFPYGAVLLRLDPSVPEARISLSRRELQAAEAQRQQACLNAERASRERNRLKKLTAEGIVSADALDQAETSAETAGAGVELSSRQQGMTVIRAPFDGIVADLSVEVGEYTTPSPPGMPIPPVLDILDPRSIYVSAPMDEVDSARIHPGQTARVTVDSYPGRDFPANVRRVAPYVLDREEQNRTVEIEVDLEDSGELRLLPGTSADVEVLLQAKEGVLRIPTAALLEGERALVVAGGVLVERKLGIGLKNWDWTEVISGLAEGDQVVTSLDRPEVKAGVQVKVETAPPGGAP